MQSFWKTFYFALILGSYNLLLAQQSTKPSIPDAAALKVAAKDIKDLYGEQFAKAKTSEKKLALAREFFKQGVGTADDPASRYELLRITKNIATAAGDTDLALQAINQLDKFYKIDALQLKADALDSIAKNLKTKEQNKLLTKITLALVDQAVAADRFEVAKQLSTIALAAAKKVRDRDLTKQTTLRANEIEALEAEFAKVKLELKTLDSSPTDSTANLTVGKFRCFMQNNWKKGLPMIALGSDAKLQKLAVAELKNPSTHTAQASLANGWWDLSETLEGSARTNLQQHAALWYRKALPRLSGIAKVKATRRLGELAPKTSVAKKAGPSSSSPKKLTPSLTAKQAAPKQAAPKHPAGAVQFQGHWYMLYAGRVPWSTAVQLCRRLGGQLACIETLAEARFVARLARGNRVSLGGFRNARGQWMWVNGKPMIFKIWTPGEPNNFRGRENCLLLLPSGTWNDIPNNEQLSYICEWKE